MVDCLHQSLCLRPCVPSAYLITVCVCDLVGTFVNGGRCSNVIHVEMGSVVVNVVLQEKRERLEQKKNTHARDSPVIVQA